MPTYIIQPDATAGKDTILWSGANADKNYGVTTYGNITLDTSVSLIQFDLSPIPTGSTILSAALSVGCSNASVGTVSIHRGLVEWFEGASGAADPGATDASTWNHKNANSGAPVTWGAAGGQAGTDYVSAATDSVAAPGAGQVEFDVKEDVKLFVRNTTNYGWWFINDNSDVMTIGSSDNATPANRPKISIIYKFGGSPPMIKKMMIGVK